MIEWLQINWAADHFQHASLYVSGTSFHCGIRSRHNDSLCYSWKLHADWYWDGEASIRSGCDAGFFRSEHVPTKSSRTWPCWQHLCANCHRSLWCQLQCIHAPTISPHNSVPAPHLRPCVWHTIIRAMHRLLLCLHRLAKCQNDWPTNWLNKVAYFTARARWWWSTSWWTHSYV